MSRSLSGKVVAITGGARGIGAATARAFEAAGATVVVGDLDSDVDRGGDVLPLDVADEASFAAFLDAVVGTHGRLDVLVNNAGFMVLGTHLDTPLPRQLAQVDVNLTGVVLGSHLAATRMTAAGGGAIVNIASLAGRIPMPGSAVYSATKAGVLAYSEALDAELAGTGVRVSCVLPSFTATELIEGTHGTSRLARPVSPDTVAAAVVAAASSPRLVRTVPAFLGLGGASWPLTIARLKPFLRARFGLDHVFVDVDQSERAAYVERTDRTRAAESRSAS